MGEVEKKSSSRAGLPVSPRIRFAPTNKVERGEGIEKRDEGMGHRAMRNCQDLGTK